MLYLFVPMMVQKVFIQFHYSLLMKENDLRGRATSPQLSFDGKIDSSHNGISKYFCFASSLSTVKPPLIALHFQPFQRADISVRGGLCIATKKR